MKKDHDKNIRDLSMQELFQIEIETQAETLTSGLLSLEKNPIQPTVIESLMRAAHSLKGASRLMELSTIERVAHVLEDVFVAAQKNELEIGADAVDVCLRAVDIMQHIALRNESTDRGTPELDSVVSALVSVRQGAALPPAAARLPPTDQGPAAVIPIEPPTSEESERVLRVSAERLNRMLGLSSELVVDARQAQSQVQALLHMKKKHAEVLRTLDVLRDALSDLGTSERANIYLAQLHKRAGDFRQLLAANLAEADAFDRRLSTATARMHREVILTRMRPLADGVQGFQRMVRDLARATGKKVELNIQGLRTEVDRDVLEKLEAPLTHLLRNAIDHGIESPAERRAKNKPEHGTVQLAASYSGGMLSIVLEDDGCGVDLEQLKRKIVERGLARADLAERLTVDELIEFLFLPKFSTRDAVTELSGRVVGLDVVRDAVQALGGTVKTSTHLGCGTRFTLHLPITLSLIPALLVDIGKESYAFPLARIDRLLNIAPAQVQYIEGHQYTVIDGENVGLVDACSLFGRKSGLEVHRQLEVVVLSDRLSRYGVVVDRIVGERVLAVQSLDPRLGKVRDISAAALLEDGTPTLIIDVDDFVRSVDHARRGGTLLHMEEWADSQKRKVEKRVLVVDDSITVRGVETKLLETHGYTVATAVDGMDGWNRVRSERFDLVITDVDMPRMDGVELVDMIKHDQQLKSIPVMIVSYKDRPEDRQRGLEAGADYYLTKGSFHDETLIDAVIDLIGTADS
jgi:two-component system, chemotaxis family, sensor histidine kinase and response regulator WspE